MFVVSREIRLLILCQMILGNLNNTIGQLTHLNGVAVPFKRFCDMKIRIVSQGMVKPRQLNDQYLGNLALKINSKV